ncbi:MAG: HAMP domain-containing histidine kinase [Treponema sp.]|jgi:two-component system sensor histidine kinase VanS|nr:HAMP domain-containing histidine kinase [Treponema sp.]
MKKNRSVFTKIFAYTMLLVLAISLAAVFLFAREFLSFYRAEQQRRLSVSFEPIISAMENKGASPEEIIKLASEFASKNQSFKFRIQLQEGDILFDVGNVDMVVDDPDRDLMPLRSIWIVTSVTGEPSENSNPYEVGAVAVDNSNNFTGEAAARLTGTTGNQGETVANRYIFTGFSSDSDIIDIAGLVRGFLAALVLMLAIAVLGAMLFAKKVTKPLEDEIIRERAMEENQRLFFSAASHELKTPIAAARAIVEGMIAGIGDYTDTRKYLRECLNTFDSQTRLVSEILEIVKLSGEETEVSLHFFDLADLGNAVLAEYRPLAEIKNILIKGEFPHVTVRCDRGLLQRVLSNVISNAVAYTEEGQEIRIVSETGKNTRLRILNTGARISDSAMSKIFQPFFRPDTARTRHGTQSGLGLTIVKKSLDRMKIPFALENTEEGVLFWVDLPFHQVEKS